MLLFIAMRHAIIVALYALLLSVFLITCYLHFFTTGGNHWSLFGSPLERFLINYQETISYGAILAVVLLVCLTQGIRNKVIVGSAGLALVVFIITSLFIFLD